MSSAPMLNEIWYKTIKKVQEEQDAMNLKAIYHSYATDIIGDYSSSMWSQATERLVNYNIDISGFHLYGLGITEE
jgi:hypothetical protein